MRKLLLSLFAAAMAFTAAAQIQVATFDTLTLSQADTYYLNYTMPMQDVGFEDGGAHFPCVYDTSFGGIWDHGFAYSNMTDSVTSGYLNQYSVKAAKGYNNSDQYAVAWCSAYGSGPTRIIFNAATPDSVIGFYVCNSTFAYNSMRDGDAIAKKFGGLSGNDPDWFLLTIKGYLNGSLKPDSVNFYLADFRSANNLNDYIVGSWGWVNLLPLGRVDSLEFALNSSDTAGGNGMNTPAYFCMDNLVSVTNPISVKHVAGTFAAKMYPNPSTNVLYVETNDNNARSVEVYDASGKLVISTSVTGKTTELHTAGLSNGTYFLKLVGNGQVATASFIKQ